MRRPTPAKTPEQLAREIAYFERELVTRTCPDRRRRARVAIAKRQRLLAEAQRVERAPSITCPRCRLTSYHPSDIRERYCGFCHRFHDDLTPEARP